MRRGRGASARPSSSSCGGSKALCSIASRPLGRRCWSGLAPVVIPHLRFVARAVVTTPAAVVIPHLRFAAGAVATALAAIAIPHVRFVAGAVATTVAPAAQEHRADKDPDQDEGDDPGHPHPDGYAGHQSADSHVCVPFCRALSCVVGLRDGDAPPPVVVVVPGMVGSSGRQDESGMRQPCRLSSVPRLPGRKLGASLDAPVNGQPGRAPSRREGRLAQRRSGRSAGALPVSRRAASESAAGASGRTTRKTEPPPGRAR
jgi:hypothetical protein